MSKILLQLITNMNRPESLKNTLKTLGLPRDAAMIYSLLLMNGVQKASQLVRESRITRPLVYRALDELQERSLVSSAKRQGRVTLFEALDPRQLRSNLDKQIEGLQTSQLLLDGILPNLLSHFMKQTDKPVFRFEDTLEGVIEILQSSNYAESTIYQYIDPNIMETEQYQKLTSKITTERLKLGTNKVLLYPDTPLSHRYIETYPDFEQYISSDVPALPVILLTYDNTIALISHDGTTVRGYSINDAALAGMITLFLKLTWRVLS
jgi:sugar-specific transcriptional regulator TrmB